MIRGKERIDISLYLGKPFSSLDFRARNNNAEHAAVKIGNPAKTEDAILVNDRRYRAIL